MGLRARRPRFAGVVVVVVSAIALALAAMPGVAAAGGATVLRGTFASNQDFVVNGTPTFFAFTCDEQRVQLPDGSARDTAHCRLNANETPPPRAAQAASVGYESDFFVNNAPGFAGGAITSDWHGVLTPSGNVTMVADFPAS